MSKSQSTSNHAPLLAVAALVIVSATAGVFMQRQSEVDRRDRFADARFDRPATLDQRLADIAEEPRLLGTENGNRGRTQSAVLGAFEVKGDRIVAAAFRDRGVAEAGLLAWQRLITLFPQPFRKELNLWNIVREGEYRGLFGRRVEFVEKRFVQPRAYRIELARDVLLNEPNLGDPLRPLSASRHTLDWTLVHEMAHYITVHNGAIEAFVEAFGAASGRLCPSFDRFPTDGAPQTRGEFVSLYACAGGPAEDVAESLSAYLLLERLPDNASLAADKILFFERFGGLSDLRAHIQRFR